MGLQFRHPQKPRSPGQEQPDSKLNRRHVGDQVELGHHGEQIQIALQGGPGRERDEGRRQGQAGIPG